MNRNHLKFIACLTMLIDHAGLLLFPGAEWMRWVGRLAMPLFAFFIAEGCRYTSHKLRYFLRIFILGLLCQSVYIAEQLIRGHLYSFYLNILLTFSVSMLICFAYLFHEKQAMRGDGVKAKLSAALFLLTVLGAVGLCALCTYITRNSVYHLYFDYALPGMLLPLAAVAFSDRQKQFVAFSFALILFCVVCREQTSYVWFALIDIPLLALYNGKQGKTVFKYGFYLFYPLHLGLLYLLQAII